MIAFDDTAGTRARVAKKSNSQWCCSFTRTKMPVLFRDCYTFLFAPVTLKIALAAHLEA